MLGVGNQNWRLVSLMVASDKLFWGSDNDQTGSAIFSWDFRKLELRKKIGIT